MPAGYIHLNIWRRYLRAVPLVSAGLMVVHWQLGLGFLLGYLLGYYIDPDLDQVGMSSVEGRLLNDFKLAGAFIVAFWIPYGYLSKHRGISHFPFIGTAIRWLYMLAFVVVLVRPSIQQVQSLLPAQIFGLGVYLGNAISDILHAGADFGWVPIKRTDRRKR